jgi:hypothetical protein
LYFLETEPDRTCLYGVTALAGSDYANFGVGLLLQMSYSSEQGALLAPWDATLHGIVGLRFRIDLAPGSNSLRLGVNMANSSHEALLLDRGAATIHSSGIVEASWDDFEPASWASDPIDWKVDPTRITTLSLQAVASVGSTHAYNFCLSDFEWLDAQGNAVPVEPLQAVPRP